MKAGAVPLHSLKIKGRGNWGSFLCGRAQGRCPTRTGLRPALASPSCASLGRLPTPLILTFLVLKVETVIASNTSQAE